MLEMSANDFLKFDLRKKLIMLHILSIFDKIDNIIKKQEIAFKKSFYTLQKPNLGGVEVVRTYAL